MQTATAQAIGPCWPCSAAVAAARQALLTHKAGMAVRARRWRTRPGPDLELGARPGGAGNTPPRAWVPRQQVSPNWPTTSPRSYRLAPAAGPEAARTLPPRDKAVSP